MQEEERLEGVSVHAGFPNPAADRTLGDLDLNQLLIWHTASTYMFRLRGSGWEDVGIFDGDIAIVDRALTPKATDLVIWWPAGQDSFSISRCKLVPAGTAIWGVTTAIVHQFRESTDR